MKINFFIAITILSLVSLAKSDPSEFDSPDYFFKWVKASEGNIPFRSLWGIISYYKEIQYVSNYICNLLTIPYRLPTII